MSTLNMFEIYADMDSLGSGQGWNMDEALNLDSVGNKQVTLESETALSPAAGLYTARELIGTEAIFEITETLDPVSFVDILTLVPEKFRDSDILQAYLDEVGIQTGTWMAQIDGLLGILDPYRAGRQFLTQLAGQIGLDLVVDETTTTAEIRRQVTQAVEWYKRKGTYESLTILARLAGLDVTILDGYTNDYVFFEWVEWFVGDEGENPEGLDSSYYKSAHFGLQVTLNQVLGTASDPYLWRDDQFAPIREFVELTRPVNTVPHFLVYINPQTDQTGQANEVAGEIFAATTPNWTIATLFLDAEEELGSAEGWNADDGSTFDQTESGFINGTNVWKVGTGNKGISPDETGFALETVVLTGTVDKIRTLSDRIEYEFIVQPSVDITGISELGLFDSGGTELRAAATFPDIDLNADTELRILVSVFLQPI